MLCEHDLIKVFHVNILSSYYMCLALLLTDGYHLLIILSFIIFSEFTKTFFSDM